MLLRCTTIDSTAGDTLNHLLAGSGSDSRCGGRPSVLRAVIESPEHEISALVYRRNYWDKHDDYHRCNQLVCARKCHEARNTMRRHHVDEAM